MSDGAVGIAGPIPLNILKCRDDVKPVFFTQHTEATADKEQQFIQKHDSECSWIKQGELFGSEKLRPRIEPWLTALCQSEHLSWLVGAGLSNAVHCLATGHLLRGMGSGNFGEYDEVIKREATKTANSAGRGDGNIEDEIRVANELLRGLEKNYCRKGILRIDSKELVINVSFRRGIVPRSAITLFLTRRMILFYDYLSTVFLRSRDLSVLSEAYFLTFSPRNIPGPTHQSGLETWL